MWSFPCSSFNVRTSTVVILLLIMSKGIIHSIDKVTRRDCQLDRISKSSVFWEAWPWQCLLQWTVNR